MVNTTYILTAVHKCGVVNKDVKFDEGFSYVITPAPCFGSQGTLKYFYNANSVVVNQESYEKDVDGNFPIIKTPSSNGYVNYQFLLTNNTLYCNINFLTAPLSLNVPIYTIVGDMCGLESHSGSINVTNASDYDEIRINNTVAVNGYISGLAGLEYELYLESEKCGLQIFQVPIPTLVPTIELSLNTSCMTNLSVTPTLIGGPDSSDGIWTRSGAEVTPPFLIEDYSSETIMWSYSKSCSAVRYVKFNRPILPIRHEILSSTYDCTNGTLGKIVIKIHHLVSNLSLLFSESESGQPLNISSDNTLVIEYGQKVSVYDNGCYSIALEYTIYYGYPFPILEYSKESLLSFENVTITVKNYLDFQDIFIRDSSTLIEYYPDESGVFTVISSIYYAYVVNSFRNCSSNTLNLFIPPGYSSPNVAIKYVITKNPDCIDNAAYANVTLTHNTLGVIGTYNNQQFFPNTTLYLAGIFRQIEYTYQWLTPILPYDIPYNASIVVQNSTCQYGNGTIQVVWNSREPNIGLQYFLDDVLMQYYPDSAWSASVGDHVVKIVNYYSDKCSNLTFNAKVSNSNSYQLSYTIENVTDCSSSGWLRFTSFEFSSLSILQIATGNIVPFKGAQTDFSLPGGYYQISFADLNGLCTGTKNIFIDTKVNSYTPTYSILSNPTCEISDLAPNGEIDGYAAFALKGQTDEPVPITYIYNYANNKIDRENKAIQINPGNNEIGIQLNQCQFRVSLDVKVNYPDFKFTKISSYSCWTDAEASENFKVECSNPNIEITTAYSDNEITSFSKTTDYNIISGVVDPKVFLKWNGCVKSYIVKTTPIDFQPKLSLVAECGEYDGYIQVENADEYLFMLYPNIYPDEQGRIYNIFGFINSGYSYYYTHIASNCGGEGNYSPDITYLSEYQVDTKVLNESCSGSLDSAVEIVNPSGISYLGSITVSTQPRKQVVANEGYPNENFIFYSQPTSNTFDNLPGDSYYMLYHWSLDNKLCLQKSDYFMLYAKEPVLKTNSTESDCTYSIEGTIDRIGQFQIKNGTTDLGTATDHQIPNISPGTYNVSIDINTNRCRRNDLLTSIVVPPLPESCSEISKGEDKSKTGLIVGLVVGIIGALLVGLAIAYFINRRKKVIKEKPELIPMSTVNIFTGGKVGKIDEF